MTLKSYLSVMIAATALCWVAVIFLVFTVDPEITNWVGFLLFYAAVFLSLIGSSAIIGFLIRFKSLKHPLAFRSVRDAFRQSVLFAFMAVVALILLSKNLFTWFNLMLLIISISALEFFLINYRKSQ